MVKIYIVVVAIGCFLSNFDLLVESLPIKQHEESLPTPQKDPQTKTKTKINDNRQAPYADDAGWEPAKHKGTVGMVMFPKNSKDTNKTVEPEISQVGGAKDGGGGERFTEMTVSVPDFNTDKFGNYLYGRGGVSNENINDERRFKEYHRSVPTPSRARAANYPKNYTPPPFDKLSTVCGLRSTIYNVPVVMDYLRPRIQVPWRFRVVWLDLRETLYKDGNSQECHRSDMTNWQEYIHCAIRRNMRMEYLIPKYPLHQQGVYSNWINREVLGPHERWRDDSDPEQRD